LSSRAPPAHVLALANGSKLQIGADLHRGVRLE
jgi:hypothetical protein